MPTLAQSSQIEITKFSEHIGAEIRGLDLTQPVDEATRSLLYDAVVENIALVIRDQKFTADQFLEASRLFGEPMERPSGEYAMSELPFVHEISSEQKDRYGNRKKVGPIWHTDHTNLESPPNFTFLYGVSVPDSGGGTSLCNTREGYNRLPAALKERVDSMKTVNIMLGSAVKRGDRGLADTIAMQESLKPEPVVHPLVRTHPDTGGKAIYFNPTKTENIIGMSPEESQDFLQGLVDRLVSPDLTYTHQWQRGDLLVWDNRSSLHKANFDFDAERNHRLLYRVIGGPEVPH